MKMRKHLQTLLGVTAWDGTLLAPSTQRIGAAKRPIIHSHLLPQHIKQPQTSINSAKAENPAEARTKCYLGKITDCDIVCKI